MTRITKLRHRCVFLTFWLLVSVELRSAEPPDDFVVYVSNEHSGNVSVLNGRTREVVATWPAGKRPRGIHVSPRGDLLYVAVSGSPIIAPGAYSERAKSTAPDKAADAIVVIDTKSGKTLRRLSVGSDPEQFAVTQDGLHLIVANEDESAATCWDLGTGLQVFKSQVSEAPEGVSIQPTGMRVWITCAQRGDVFVLDANTGAKAGTFKVSGRPRSVAFLPDGTRAFVPARGNSEVTVVTTADLAVVKAIKIPGPDVLPTAAVVSADGRWVYVSTGRGNSVAIIDAQKLEVVETVPVGTRPWGIGLSPDQRYLFTANGQSDDLSIIDLGQRKETARLKVGPGPWGIAVGPRRME